MWRLLAILGFASVFLAFSNGQFVETTDDEGQEWIGPLKKCPLGTVEEMNACLRQTVLDISAATTNGIPEFGLQSLDPFKMGKFDFKEKIGPFNILVKSKNLVLHGMTKYKSIDFKVDLKNRIMSFEYELPTLKMDADYKLAGNIIIPLSGSGPANIEVSNLKVSGHWVLKKVDREDGVSVVQVDTAVIDKMTIGRMHTRMPGLFNGNPILSGFIHYVANNFGPQVLEFIKPQVTSMIGDITTNNILNPGMYKLPYLAEYF